MAAYFSSCSSEGNDESGRGDMSEFMGPGQIDQMIRQAINFCWMTLPKERKNADELEKQVQRLVSRAIRDFRDDAEAFGRAI